MEIMQFKVNNYSVLKQKIFSCTYSNYIKSPKSVSDNMLIVLLIAICVQFLTFVTLGIFNWFEIILIITLINIIYIIVENQFIHYRLAQIETKINQNLITKLYVVTYVKLAYRHSKYSTSYVHNRQYYLIFEGINQEHYLLKINKEEQKQEAQFLGELKAISKKYDFELIFFFKESQTANANFDCTMLNQ